MADCVTSQTFVFGRPGQHVTVSLCARQTWAEREEDARLDMRTGHVLWRPAAFMLSQALASADLCRGARVLELGAGVGLAAAVACCRSAPSVIATDGAATVLDLASLNLSRNSSAGAEQHRDVAVLKWGDAADTAAVQALLRDRSGDKSSAFADRCDLVIGSDCFFPRPLDPDLTIAMQGTAMFGTAAKLMRPCSCSSCSGSHPGSAAAAASAAAASPATAEPDRSGPCDASSGSDRCGEDTDKHSSGLLLTTFQVRRRGMNRELRAAAAAVGLAICFVDRDCILQTARGATGSEPKGPGSASAGGGAAPDSQPLAAHSATPSAADAACIRGSAGTDVTDACSMDAVRFDPDDPMLRYARIALLAPCAAALEARMAALGWRRGDPAEDEDDMPPPAHETLAGGLFPDSDDDDER